MFRLPTPRLARPLAATIVIALGACGREPPPPPPPPVSAATTTTTTTAAPTSAVATTTAAPTPPPSVPVATMVPVTTAPTPDPSTLALSADAVICGAALQCCESTAHAARTAARREGIDPRDPRFDPRRDPRYDDRYDPGYGYGDPRDDPRVRRATQHLVAGCQQLRAPDAAHASRCAQQIESIRRALREAGAPVPSSCRVPDLPATMPAGMPAPQ